MNRLKDAALSGKDRFVSLNFKLTVVIVIAAVLTLGIFFVCSLIEKKVADGVFKAGSVKTRFINNRYDELKRYISQNDVKATDVDALAIWLKKQRYTDLVVYGIDGSVYSSNWVVDSAGHVSTENSSISQITKEDEGTRPKMKNELRIDAGHFKSDVMNRNIRFADGWYYVFIDVHYELAWNRIMNIVIIVFSALVFFLVLLGYNRNVLRRISKLSDDVGIISDGFLNYKIQPGLNDEIGSLARSVETMRSSLAEQMENEKAAINANAELITSMSHDIRTPLTSLIGYLDIIADGRYESVEQLKKYTESCKDKAFQLKGLSDKLFNYFLVFGGEDRDDEIEVIDGGILFQQLLGEHISEVITRGFQAELLYNVPENTMLRTDLSAIMRVFDNLFSNIMKYANIRFPVLIKADLTHDGISMIFQNHIRQSAKKVESTKIGVKTCRKICQDLGAGFHATEKELIYTTVILFPVMPQEEAKIAAAVADAEVREENEERISDKEQANSDEVKTIQIRDADSGNTVHIEL